MEKGISIAGEIAGFEGGTRIVAPLPLMGGVNEYFFPAKRTADSFLTQLRTSGLLVPDATNAGTLVYQAGLRFRESVMHELETARPYCC